MLEPYDDDIALRVEHVGADPIEVDLRAVRGSPATGRGVARATTAPSWSTRSPCTTSRCPDAVALPGRHARRRRRDLGRHPRVRRGRAARAPGPMCSSTRRAGRRRCAAVIAGTTFETIFSYHADTVPLGALAERAGVPHVVLTHLIPPPDTADAAAAFAADVRDGGYRARSRSATTSSPSRSLPPRRKRERARRFSALSAHTSVGRWPANTTSGFRWPDLA